MSEFWLRKMRHFFKVHDFDKDGYIDENDFGEIARKFSEFNNATPEKKEEQIRLWRKCWRILMKFEDLEENNRLTLDSFIRSLRRQLYDPDFTSVCTQIIHRMFELLDVSQDGYLQAEEHKRWFDNMGFPEEAFDREAAFEAIDADHDNQLSIDEFDRAFFDFMFSQDESSPNKFFFGPLVD